MPQTPGRKRHLVEILQFCVHQRKGVDVASFLLGKESSSRDVGLCAVFLTPVYTWSGQKCVPSSDQPPAETEQELPRPCVAHVARREANGHSTCPSARDACFSSKRRFPVCPDGGESRATGSGPLGMGTPSTAPRPAAGQQDTPRMPPGPGLQGGSGVRLRERGDISRLGPRIFPPPSRVI